MDHDLKTEALKYKASGVFSLVLMAVLVFPLQPVMAAEEGEEPKQISGISIIGSDETPKSLFIVPWKSSEIGSETSLNSGLMDDSLRPVDKDVFMREIEFYEIRHTE
ncbi:MAG: hypothetical protein R6X15_00780 [Pseudomonadota bacterium]